MPTPNIPSTPAHRGTSTTPGAHTSYPAAPDATTSAVQGPRRRSGRSRLAVVGVAAVAALLDWVILAPIAGLTLTARQGGVQHIGAPAVVISTIVVAFAGWALLSILERRTPRARDIWTVVATIVCITSLGSPLTNGIGTGAKLGLASLHLVVGAIVILGLRRTALAPSERC
ncbi:DUF6069 family protein [Kribbella sp. NPDC048928]|uniref:DUF6069 family protein n=1 Tax=Kribbella sp. NPDC048928 TaxID=3364111 RepID=UPI00371DC503